MSSLVPQGPASRTRPFWRHVSCWTDVFQEFGLRAVCRENMHIPRFRSELGCEWPEVILLPIQGLSRMGILLVESKSVMPHIHSKKFGDKTGCSKVNTFY